jgi:hypothetical protein
MDGGFGNLLLHRSRTVFPVAGRIFPSVGAERRIFGTQKRISTGDRFRSGHNSACLKSYDPDRAMTIARMDHFSRQNE